MDQHTSLLLAQLDSIQGTGAFYSTGAFPLIYPGLHIEGLGEIAFPLQPEQANAIAAIAQKAPFGKGSATITDTAVRSAWEIDAKQITFRNLDWTALMAQLLEQVKVDMGIETQTVSAKLYKLLLYEQGDFFLPHKDSEKKKGMFGTLVIGLPSTYTGGELQIEFDGRTITADFIKDLSGYKIPYVAFFADCEHEIKPVTAGYRICLVYNLLQTNAGAHIKTPCYGEQVKEMTAQLQKMKPKAPSAPQIFLLAHQYTPANFSLQQLKHHDQPKAEALLAAAKAAGYMATLGLVTHYQMGQLIGREEDYGYRSNRHFHENRDGNKPRAMGSVYEESSFLKTWDTTILPGLGEIYIIPELMLNAQSFGQGAPIEQAAEGYTGNAGMTLEYWYHHGAVIFWPKEQHLTYIQYNQLEVNLNWMAYYANHWEEPGLDAPVMARTLLNHLAKQLKEKESAPNLDFSPLAEVLRNLVDPDWMESRGTDVLFLIFRNISIPAWIRLMDAYPADMFKPLWKAVGRAGKAGPTSYLLEILRALEAVKSDDLSDFVQHQVERLPKYLGHIRFAMPDRIKEGQNYSYNLFVRQRNPQLKIQAILEHTIHFCQHADQPQKWANKIVESVEQYLTPGFVQEDLAPVLLLPDLPNNQLVQALAKLATTDLEIRTATAPEPPANWTLPVPKVRQHKHIWEILRPFMESPTQTVFEYRQAQGARSNMETAIQFASADLDMETIRKGSPHTLKLTKNRASYDQAMHEFNEDVLLLANLKRRYGG